MSEKATCAKERVKVTMRASDAICYARIMNTRERARTRLAVCQKDDRMKN